jgi:hypothetical protein
VRFLKRTSPTSNALYISISSPSSEVNHINTLFFRCYVLTLRKLRFELLEVPFRSIMTARLAACYQRDARTPSQTIRAKASQAHWLHTNKGRGRKEIKKVLVIHKLLESGAYSDARLAYFSP